MSRRVKVIITVLAITLLLPIKASAVTLGEYEAAVENGVNTLDMWTKTKANGFTVK